MSILSPGTARTASLALLAAAALGASATAASPQAGAAIFTSKCAGCHNALKGGGNGLGPNLFGVVGRKAGSAPGFGYSPALKNSGILWTEDKLKQWVQNPQKLVPGTRMVLIGPPDARQAGDLAAYLNTRK